MLAAFDLRPYEKHNRQMFLYDTYTGMPAPTEKDRDVFTRMHAPEEWAAQQRADYNEWCYASLPEVRTNLQRTGFPLDRIHFVKRKVEETLPDVIPDEIALLRLDTDFYESTLHELTHLYPRLSLGGVWSVDDHGHWTGAREAVDQYFSTLNHAPLLNRLDYTGRIAVKVAR